MTPTTLEPMFASNNSNDLAGLFGSQIGDAVIPNILGRLEEGCI